MGKRADIGSTLLNTHGGDLQDFVESAATLTDDNTLSGNLTVNGVDLTPNDIATTLLG